MKNSTHADLGPYSCDRIIALTQKSSYSQFCSPIKLYCSAFVTLTLDNTDSMSTFVIYCIT